MVLAFFAADTLKRDLPAHGMFGAMATFLVKDIAAVPCKSRHRLNSTHVLCIFTLFAEGQRPNPIVAVGRTRLTTCQNPEELA